jgi:two-component system KDP operon response regulator KdpE
MPAKDPRGPRHRILVVDDEPRMIRFIQMNLELEGYEVIQATNGFEALNQVRDALPDLVILDVMMPNLDGFETLRCCAKFQPCP